MRTLPVTAVLISGLLSAVYARPAGAELGVPIEVPFEEAREWSFVGPLGRYDQAQLRRGFQVYMETCGSCHSLRQVAYRNLSALGIGFGPDDIKALAADFKVQDGPDESGKMFMRPATPADRLVPPYPNKEAARVANNGMYPPDLSLIAKARKGGPHFLRDFLIAYGEPPPDVSVRPGMYYNAAVSGQQTGMAPVLSNDLVSYEDGTEATVEQMAKDVTAFLVWTADPHMQARKTMGFKVVIFLALLTIMFIALKREVWAHLHRAPPADGKGLSSNSAPGSSSRAP
jgi:ubiquinol-cytochrome c reductase cytochrome c1 subunit